MSTLNFWHWVTRLGEVQILLPLMLVLAASSSWPAEGRKAVVRWMIAQCSAIALTTASKLAFIGWGIGWPELNFTGISGHAMFAASAFPLFAQATTSGLSGRYRSPALAVGILLAVLVGVSRVVVGAHSPSEVVAGLAVGSWAGAAGLSATRQAEKINVLIPLSMVAWLALMPGHVPALQTHSMVTHMALALSGHERPYTRADMLLRLRQKNDPHLAKAQGASR